MIVCDLKDLERQCAMTPALRLAMNFLRRTDLHKLPDGRQEIDGERVYAIVQRYHTAPAEDPRFEYHRKYIDIQCILTGDEVIGWAHVDLIAITEAYDADRDIAFGTVPGNRWTPVLLQPRQAAVLYPEDGHAPKLATRAASAVMKVVVKVASERFSASR